MKNEKLRDTELDRKKKDKENAPNTPRLFSPFLTERMEDYAALSLAALIIILVLIMHQ